MGVAECARFHRNGNAFGQTAAAFQAARAEPDGAPPLCSEQAQDAWDATARQALIIL